MNDREIEEFRVKNIGARWENVKSYHMVYAESTKDLSTHVSTMLNADWKLHGSPMVDDVGYYQAVVKDQMVRRA